MLLPGYCHSLRSEQGRWLWPVGCSVPILVHELDRNRGNNAIIAYEFLFENWNCVLAYKILPPPKGPMIITVLGFLCVEKWPDKPKESCDPNGAPTAAAEWKSCGPVYAGSSLRQASVLIPGSSGSRGTGGAMFL